MKKILIIITLLLITSNLFCQWDLINRFATFNFYDVHFLNKDTGFVVGDTIFWEDGVILKTVDGGENWDTTILNSTIWSIYFINNDTGFAGSDHRYFYKTTDCGNTWDEIDISSSNLPVYFFQSMYFRNNLRGFMTSITSGRAAETFDGGLNWQRLYADYPANPATPIEIRLGKLSFPTDSIGYVGCKYKSIDGGENWKYVYDSIVSPNPMNCNYGANSIAEYLTNDYGMIGGQFITGIVGWQWAKGHIHVTHDGGSNYVMKKFDYIKKIKDIIILNENESYAVGWVNYDSNQEPPYTSPFLKSIDGGNTWYYQDFDIDTTQYPNIIHPLLTAISCPTDKLGFAVGYGGVIYKTTDGGGALIPIIPYTNIQEENNKLESLIYPNPTSDILNIKYSGVIIQNFSLKIYNTQGKLVQTGGANIFDNYLQINVSSLPSGIYFIKMEGGKSKLIHKFIKN